MKLTPLLKYGGWIVGSLFLLGLLSSSGLAYLLMASCKQPPIIIVPSTMAEPVKNTAKQTLNVMTINIAHGGKDGFSQLLQSSDTIYANLNAIASVIRQAKPDIVALQEVDGPSFWSGGFSHIRYLISATGLEYAVRGQHVQGLNLSYGTALLSKLPLQKAQSFRFALSPPSFPKGYVIATINWPGKTDKLIDVVSLHLDFLRSSVREKQIKSLIKNLSNSQNHFIIMGDFNSDWKDSPLQQLSQQMNLQAYQPTITDGLSTFPLTGRRLDWILISSELRFTQYKVLPDRLSDHLAVIAELQID
jgi:endonuclease/exonuclease/phosphatase family metal-dependent hydrolase